MRNKFKSFITIVALASAFAATTANATLIDDFSTGGLQSTTDFGGNVTFTSTGPVATGTGWTRQIDMRATGNAVQNINALITGGILPTNFLALSETANSSGVRFLSWDTLTAPITVGVNDVIDFDFKNVDQSFQLTLDLNAFNSPFDLNAFDNPIDFTINPGDTHFMAHLTNWFTVGSTFDNVSAIIISQNRGVDLELYSVSTHVPEPESIVMIGIGLLALGLGLKTDKMVKSNRTPMAA
jgi:hypothetical protein